MQVRLEIAFQFLFGIAQHAGIFGAHADIDQVVQIGKDRYPAQLGYPGKEDKAGAPGHVRPLERAQKGFQNIAVGPGDLKRGFSLAQVIDDGLVIFIDQNDYGLVGLAMQFKHQLLKFALQQWVT